MSLRDEFNSLFHSDLSCAGAESLQALWTGVATVSLAHLAIGMIVSVVVLYRGYSHRWLWAGFAAILLKEVAGDIPNSGFSLLVILDSGWDLGCYFVGFCVQWWAMMAGAEGEA